MEKFKIGQKVWISNEKVNYLKDKGKKMPTKFKITGIWHNNAGCYYEINCKLGYFDESNIFATKTELLLNNRGK